MNSVYDTVALYMITPQKETIEIKARTLRQNSALHLYFSNLAEALNDAGLDMKATLKPNVEIPWSGDRVKEFLWRPIQQLQVDKKSTTELSTKEIDKIYDTLTRHLGEKFGVTVPFPSEEELSYNQ